MVELELQRFAYRRGLARSAAARARGGTHRDGWTPESQDQRATDGQSAVAEYLVAAALERRWLSDGLVPDPDGVDVEGGITVRWTRRDDGSLILRERDRDELIAVLVTGLAPRQQIRGWILVADGKRDAWMRAPGNRPPAWFVPRSALRPLEELEL